MGSLCVCLHRLMPRSNSWRKPKKSWKELKMSLKRQKMPKQRREWLFIIIPVCRGVWLGPVGGNGVVQHPTCSSWELNWVLGASYPMGVQWMDGGLVVVCNSRARSSLGGVFLCERARISKYLDFSPSCWVVLQMSWCKGCLTWGWSCPWCRFSCETSGWRICHVSLPFPEP